MDKDTAQRLRHLGSGIGLADGQTLCAHIAELENAGGFRRWAAGHEAYKKAVARRTAELVRSPAPENPLRVRLWCLLRQALGAPEALPLAQRRVAEEASALAVKAAMALRRDALLRRWAPEPATKALSRRASLAAAQIALQLGKLGATDPIRGLGALTNAFRGMPLFRERYCPELKSEIAKVKAKRKRIEKFLGRSLPDAPGCPPSPWDRTLQAQQDTRTERPQAPRKSEPPRIGHDAGLTGLLVAGEALYLASALDPKVIAAADFWRAADLGGVVKFTVAAHEFQSAGAAVGLRGYTAEELVMAKLKADGHHVARPSTPNNPEYDLLVDGYPVQVKCAESLSAVREHFAVYPHIPVVANCELAQASASEPWAHNIWTVDGFDLRSVQEATDATIEAGAALATLDALPAAFAVGAARGVMNVVTGALPLDHLPAWLVVDASVRGLLTYTGGKLGAAIGMLAVGPAGAVILGPVVAVAALLGTDKGKRLLDRNLHPEWYKGLGADYEMLRITVERSLHRWKDRKNLRKSALTQHAAQLASDFRHAPEVLRVWIERRAWDDAIAKEEILDDTPHRLTHVEDALALEIVAQRLAPADPQVRTALKVLQKRMDNRPMPGWALAQKTVMLSYRALELARSIAQQARDRRNTKPSQGD